MPHVFSVFRAGEQIRRLQHAQRRLGNAAIELAVGRIGVRAHPKTAAIRRANLHGKQVHRTLFRSAAVCNGGEIIGIAVEHELVRTFFDEQTRAFATRSASTFVRSQRNGSIEAKRKRLCKILSIAHAHIGAYALRGGKLRKRFLHNERHAERAGVIIAVATRNKRECGALLTWNSHETRKRFVNDPVAAHGKHAIEVRCLRRKRRRMPSFTGGLNLNALKGSRGRASRISQKSCAASAIPISCRWIHNCQRFAHARHVRTSPNRRTCGEISSGGIIQRNGDVPSTKNTSKHKSNRTARRTFGRRGGWKLKKRKAARRRHAYEPKAFSIAR